MIKINNAEQKISSLLFQEFFAYITQNAAYRLSDITWGYLSDYMQFTGAKKGFRLLLFTYAVVLLKKEL